MTKARSNATANAAKGDLTVGNGTNLSGVLSVSQNGETIVADSSTSTGLRYTANFAAGKNKIINGDFGVWQRGTSFTANNIFTADRYNVTWNGTPTVAISQQTFSPGTAPVAGYEGQYFHRFAITAAGSGNTYSLTQTRIEDVRTFAGQTAVWSFWAKADTNRTIAIGVRQNYGSGGSAETYPTSIPASFALTTSWQRFSSVITFGSVSGKTIGTGSYIALDFYNVAGVTQTIDTWGWQLEAGSVATAFQTATGTIQGELAACQRYYWRANAADTYSIFGTAIGSSGTQAFGYLMPNVKMRRMNSMTSSNICLIDGPGTLTAVTLALQNNYTSDTLWGIVATAASGLTANRPYHIQANNNSAAFVAIDGEL